MAESANRAALTDVSPPAPPQRARGAQPLDVDRLLTAVDGLLERYAALQDENRRLEARMAERDDELRELQQRRQDARKRIDDLIARIEEIDQRFDAEAD